MTAGREDDELAAEYVTGLLEGEARIAVERRLAIDPVFAATVEGWRQRLAELDDTADVLPVPEDLWRRVETATADAPPEPVPERPPFLSWLWNSLPVMRTASIAGLAMVVILGVGLVASIRQGREQPRLVAVLLDGNRAGAVVHAFADGRVVLLPLTGIDVPAGRALEVWTLPSRERGPVSVGLMGQARTLELSLKDLPAPSADQLFEITLEPATGSPTGRPTGPILFKGNTALPR